MNFLVIAKSTPSNASRSPYLVSPFANNSPSRPSKAWQGMRIRRDRWAGAGRQIRPSVKDAISNLQVAREWCHWLRRSWQAIGSSSSPAQFPFEGVVCQYWPLSLFRLSIPCTMWTTGRGNARGGLYIYPRCSQVPPYQEPLRLLVVVRRLQPEDKIQPLLAFAQLHFRDELSGTTKSHGIERCGAWPCFADASRPNLHDTETELSTSG